MQLSPVLAIATYWVAAFFVLLISTRYLSDFPASPTSNLLFSMGTADLLLIADPTIEVPGKTEISLILSITALIAWYLPGKNVQEN